MSTRVKICGITSLTDAQAAVAAGADALGFVFVPGTPRFVEPSVAVAIVRELPPFVTAVGLFVNAEAGAVRDTIRLTGIQALQLHGEETPEYARPFRETLKVIKAFRVRGAESLAVLPAYLDAADAFLLDAYVPGAHGGTGARFDWELAVTAKEYGKPVILAGGLSPENAAAAVRRVQPYAVDVSSGVEAGPGRKDHRKLREFLAACR